MDLFNEDRCQVTWTRKPHCAWNTIEYLIGGRETDPCKALAREKYNEGLN